MNRCENVEDWKKGRMEEQTSRSKDIEHSECRGLAAYHRVGNVSTMMNQTPTENANSLFEY